MGNSMDISQTVLHRTPMTVLRVQPKRCGAKVFAGLLILCIILPAWAQAACVDNVVLVHGNTGRPSDWDNTYIALLNSGYNASQIYRPDWGSKTCAACNDHRGSEETPVQNALSTALQNSCTGKIDVIGHSMGVTLAGAEIIKLGISSRVDSFVGIAGALRGLNSCGMYPFNVPTTTCSTWGLSVSSPFLDDLYGQRFGQRMYSIKSYLDQVVCATGICTVGGVHSSQIWNENQSYTFNSYGHFGLQSNTGSLQVQLIR